MTLLATGYDKLDRKELSTGHFDIFVN